MISGQGQGLLAVAVAGAVIAIAQWAIRRFGQAGVRARQMKDECARILVLSEDLHRHAVGQLRGTAAPGSVQRWDASAYRRTRARLQAMSPPVSLLTALTELDETIAELRMASEISAALMENRPSFASAVQAHSDAIEHFATAGAILARVSWPASAALDESPGAA